MTDSSSRSPTKSRWDQPNPIQSSSPSSIPTAPKSSRWDQPTKEAPTSSSTSRSDHSSLPPAMPRSQQKSYDSSRDYRDRERDGWKDSRDSDFERRTSNGHDDYYNSRRDSNVDSSYGRSHGSSSRDRDRYEDGYKGKERDYERGGDRRGTNDRDYYSSSRDRDRRDSYEDGRDSYGRSYSSYHDGGRDDYSSRSYDRNDAYGRDRDRRYDDEDRYYNRGGNRGSYANGSGSNHNSRRNSHERDDEYYRHHSKSRKEERSISRDSPKTDFKDLSIKSEKGYENGIKKEEDGNQRLSSEKMDSKEGVKSVKKEEDLESDSENPKPSTTSKTNSNPIKRERRSSTSSETDSERSDSTSSTSSSTSSSPRKSKSKSRSRSQSQSVPQSPTKSKSKPIGKGKAKNVKNNKTTPLKQVQLINHLPRAENAALKSFVEIENCTYGRGLGKSRGKTDGDGMICECSWRFGPDPPTAVDACGSDSDCINRLTQVECLESECRCSVSCQNQRFQKREYADVEIVQTEKKGFGIRAGSEIQNDQFIYEYIGEVVPHEVFMKRMQKYKDEGIEHFYFMMLQKDEFLDATKKGGKGRFLNHSCNPNCYVAKWHVGKHMRMGIFAKRDIIPGEELTFNYNVDRYGNDAQECFCGEPNCVGSIGGKTQTDIGGMDDLFINALGIEDEVELLEAKGTKKKKSKHLDDDFNPTLRPMEEEEVPKVMTAVRQATDNRGILSKLLARIHMTDDTQVQKLLVRLHGFSLMSAVLDDWKDDKEIVTLTLGTLARWPLIARNKVVSAGVDQQVKDFCNDKDEEIKTLAEQLVEAWDALEVGYRIAKKEAAERRNGESKEGEETDDIFLQDRRRDQDDTEITLDTAQAPNAISAQLSRIVPRPLGTQVPTVTSSLPAKPTLGRLGLPPKARFSTSHHRSLDSPTTPGTPRSPSAYPSSSLIPGGSTTSPGASQTPQAQAPSRSILEIIRMANENEEKQRKIKEEEAERERERILAEEKKSKRISKSSTSSGKHSSDKDKEKRRREKEKERERKKRKLASAGGVEGGEASNSTDPNAPMDQQTLERRLEKLVGEIAVGAMSKQKDKFEKEEFKRYAKDLTSTICSKEKKNPKSWPPPSGRLDSFSDEKRIKIKAFSKEWITKLLQRKEEDENSFLRNGMDLDSASGNATSNPLHSSSSGGSTTTPTDGSSNTTISASISTPKDIAGLQSQIYSNADLNGKELNPDLRVDVEMESR